MPRLFSPFKFHELKPSTTDIDCLKAFPFLSSQETIDGLKMKIPKYMAASEDVSTEIDSGLQTLFTNLNFNIAFLLFLCRTFFIA